jgi:uncharacterized membrane-anchored protein
VNLADVHVDSFMRGLLLTALREQLRTASTHGWQYTSAVLLLAVVDTTAMYLLTKKAYNCSLPYHRSSRTAAGCWHAEGVTGFQSPCAAGAPRWTVPAGS